MTPEQLAKLPAYARKHIEHLERLVQQTDGLLREVRDALPADAEFGYTDVRTGFDSVFGLPRYATLFAFPHDANKLRIMVRGRTPNILEVAAYNSTAIVVQPIATNIVGIRVDDR